jgi:DNA-binding response OmpR family regulator
MKNVTTILILDDDPDICTMLKMVLSYHGYEAIIAQNEEEANKALGSQHVIDLVIMDMLLSGVDGTDICRRLKKDKATSTIPVLMFSAHPTARDVCLAAGADDFISKPFEMNDLIAKVKFYKQRNSLKQ